MKSIYTYYKERLIEISGKNRSLYMRAPGKSAYDLGRLYEGDTAAAEELTEWLIGGKNEPLVLADKTLRERLERILCTPEDRILPDVLPEEREERAKAVAKAKRAETQAFNVALEREVKAMSALKREIDDIEKETGRYELFVGYPYVFGGTRDTLFKAPLLLFPVDLEINGDNSATLYHRRGEPVMLNKAFILAYSAARRLDSADFDMEFDNLRQSGLKDIAAVAEYLRKVGLPITAKPIRGLSNYRSMPDPTHRDSFVVKNACILGRFSLANSIYNDYTELEKEKLMNDSVAALLNIKGYRYELRKNALKRRDDRSYFISSLDYAQRTVAQKSAESGNAVIYGPPGTGKSQTIVNLISDAVCKGKKVLVVSQKKAALDVVYNRLGALNVKAIFVADPTSQRKEFYAKAAARHADVTASLKTASYDTYNAITEALDAEIAKLSELSGALFTKSAFGLSLLDMYYNSFIPGKKSGEQDIYEALLADKNLMQLDYARLLAATETLLEANKVEVYYEYAESKKSNAFVGQILPDLSVEVIASAKNKLRELSSVSLAAVSDDGGATYARSLLAHYKYLNTTTAEKLYVRTMAALSYPKDYRLLKLSRIAFPLYPFAKYRMVRREKQTEKEIASSRERLNDVFRNYDFLRSVLTEEGFAMAADGALGGNPETSEKLREALDGYIGRSDVRIALGRFTADELALLGFAYRTGGSLAAMKTTVAKVLPLRIYREIIDYEDSLKEQLSLTSDFENIRTRILSLIAQQQDACRNIFLYTGDAEYREMFEKREDSKDYLYQITKKQNYLPLRKMTEMYGDYLQTLFPCWLMSPENVSSILPLTKDAFDLVLFDEASQVLIESTIPTIIRGKNIVVAGDAKQLRPTTTFMRRYMGGSEEDDPSVQAALEVESLLDLAVARYDSSNITYHYRSNCRELIDFSNAAFYGGKLCIAPNVMVPGREKPITRVLVDGKWRNRRNEAEAKAVVAIIKRILRTRKADETIGVITFNTEQQDCIEDALDAAGKADQALRGKLLSEQSRRDDGQDVGLFVKNIENVQGDERDIIIFSVGYAPGENGKVNAHFGSLSVDGGENRLNVAITRAKRRIYVVTSIEPEDLKVEVTKNNGPKLFKRYLAYARAVSSGSLGEIDAVLGAIGDAPPIVRKPSIVTPVEQQIAARLRELGYEVQTNLGSGGNILSLAVIDKDKSRYLLGVQLDRHAAESTSSALERDVFAPAFLQQKGWRLLRVWSRDWWHNPDGVIRSILAHL